MRRWNERHDSAANETASQTPGSAIASGEGARIQPPLAAADLSARNEPRINHHRGSDGLGDDDLGEHEFNHRCGCMK